MLFRSIGGKKAFAVFLEKNLVYPQAALDNRVQGVAHIKCEISDRGQVLKAQSLHPLGFGLDEEAERLCLLMVFENTTERGLKIKHTRTVRIPFVLPQQPTLTINYQTTEMGKGSYHYTIKF